MTRPATNPIRRLGQLTETLHAVVYFAPEPRAAFEQLGLRGYWRGYFAGRLAAVGAIGPDTATALLGGFAPEMVARAVPQVWTLADPAEVVAARTAAASAALARPGNDLDPGLVAEAGRLTARCVAAAPTPGRPMAAAHRGTPRPLDPVGALWHDCTVLREHRGDGHLAAVNAAGLRWPEPHLLSAGRLDAAQQQYRGWSDAEWSAARVRVGQLTSGTADGIEAETDRLAASAYDALDSAELARLIEVLTPLAVAASADLPFPNAMGLTRVVADDGSSGTGTA